MELATLKRRRNLFGAMFIVALGVLFASVSLVETFQVSGEAGFPRATPLVALLVSIAGLIGFISTAILVWRKERRDSITHALEIVKAKLEIEGLRRQVDQGSDV